MKIDKSKKIFYCSSIRKCEINSYLGSLVCSFFKNNGFPLVSDSDKADIIVINTCAVDETREKMALSVIDYHLDKYKAKKQIIVLGCLAKISPTLNNKPTDALRKIILRGSKELFKLNQIFKAKYLIESVRTNQIDKNLCNKDGF